MIWSDKGLNWESFASLKEARSKMSIPSYSKKRKPKQEKDKD